MLQNVDWTDVIITLGGAIITGIFGLLGVRVHARRKRKKNKELEP